MPNDPDTGYRYLVEILIPLNHDRYKTYFNTFLILNSGLILASIKDFAPTVFQRIAWAVCLAGVVLSIIWMIVLYKVTADISAAWKAIEAYEKDSGQKVKLTGLEETAKIKKTAMRKLPATRVMNLLPLCFIIFFILLYLTKT
jgi:hypothetical protein